MALAAALGLAGCSRPEAELRRCEALLSAPEPGESTVGCDQVFRHHLALSRAAGDHASASALAYRLFYLEWTESRYRQALEAAVAAAAEAQAAADREAEQRAAQALFSVLFSVGDLEGAARALAAAGTRLDTRQRKDRGYWLLNQAALRIEQGRPALAIHDLEQALALAGEIEDPRFPRALGLNLAEAYLALGRLDEAEKELVEVERTAQAGDGGAASRHYFRARLARARGNHREALEHAAAALAAAPTSDWAWELELDRGVAAEALGDAGPAEASFRRSIEIVERMRGELGFQELKAALLDRKRQPFEALFRLQARQGRTLEALATLERATARSFQDAFIASAVAQPPAAAWRPEAAADRVEGLRELLPALEDAPLIALAPIGEVLHGVGDRHVLLFFVAQEEVWRVRVARGAVSMALLAVSREGLEALVGAWVTDPDQPELAERLGALLVPEQALPPPGERLYLVADSALGSLSFAALTRGGRFLVEDHPVAYVPGLTALAGRPAAAAAGKAAALDAPVVLGDPAGDLPGAVEEARQVAALLSVAPRLGPAATGQALRQAAGARVLHLATHAGLGAAGPWLALADGEVRPATLLSWRVAPRLAVVASCRSAARPGRGLAGSLGAAFLAAGSEAVLATLGSVPDEAARSMVVEFYQQGGIEDPAAALARVQRSSIAAGGRPSLWAQFVILGSP